MSLISINNKALPSPAKYKVTYQDIDGSDSGRSETGIMYRNRVRSNVVKIELSWNGLSSSELAGILQAVSPAAFSVEYFAEGSTHISTMYAGDKSIEMSLYTAKEVYWDLSFNLIEF